MSELGLEGGDLGCQLGNVFFSEHGEVIALGVLRLGLFCRMGTQGDRSLLDA